MPSLFAPPDPTEMNYIRNRDIILGVNKRLGGAITYLAPVNDPTKNVVNSYDWGRQIQLSFYSGPVPFTPPGHQVSKTWLGLGWNPIQSGDAFGHTAKVLTIRNNGRDLYVKSIPMQWPLDHYPGDCQFEVWLKLDGPTVKAHCRLTNLRTDLNQYPARTQELPAVYVNGPYCHLFTYQGTEPFTNDSITEIHNRLDLENHWATWLATENWAAQVDDHNWGLGIWSPGTSRISGGFFSKQGSGGPSDPPTGYLAPNQDEILDHNIVYDFDYVLVLGGLAKIRSYVYDHRSTALPNWNFRRSREGWHYANGHDSGWPVQGKLRIRSAGGPLQLISPEFSVPTDQISALGLTALLHGDQAKATIFASVTNEDGSVQRVRVPIPSLSHGSMQYRQIPFSLGKGLLTQLTIQVEDPDAALDVGQIRLIGTR